MDRPLHSQTSAAPRGFTLLELMVTLAILGILVGITAVGITGIRPKAQLSDALSQISAILRTARDRAEADNAAVWVGYLPAKTSGADSYVVVYRDWNMNFNPATATTLALVKASAGDTSDYESGSCPGTCRHDVLEQVLDIPSRIRGVAPGTITDLSAMPDAYQWWPQPLSGVNTPVSQGCSFCQSGLGKNGWLEFLPSGEVHVEITDTSPPTQPKGALLALGVNQGNSQGQGLVSITLPFGLTTEVSQ